MAPVSPGKTGLCRSTVTTKHDPQTNNGSETEKECEKPMTPVISIEFLKVLIQYLPECVLKTTGTSIVFLDPSCPPQPEQVFRLLSIGAKTRIVHINLSGIEFFSPKGSYLFLTYLQTLATGREVSFVFTSVNSETLLSLHVIHAYHHMSLLHWAVDEQRHIHIIGTLPRRHLTLLKELQEQGTITARHVATKTSGKVSKRLINRGSVYLQELYQTGLLIRDKRVATISGEHERGWTYIYRPSYTALQELSWL